MSFPLYRFVFTWFFSVFAFSLLNFHLRFVCLYTSHSSSLSPPSLLLLLLSLAFFVKLIQLRFHFLSACCVRVRVIFLSPARSFFKEGVDDASSCRGCTYRLRWLHACFLCLLAGWMLLPPLFMGLLLLPLYSSCCTGASLPQLLPLQLYSVVFHGGPVVLLIVMCSRYCCVVQAILLLMLRILLCRDPAAPPVMCACVCPARRCCFVCFLFCFRCCSDDCFC